jgi:carbon storage regulator
MLVLTRKPGQSILIGEGIEVQVLSVSGEKVRLGITAPRDVTIFRDEVLERIQDEGDEDPREGGPGGATNGADPIEESLERLSQRRR